LPRGVAVADVNGDGHIDIVTANWGSNEDVSVLLGNGDGTFQSPQNFPAGPANFSVAVGDFNRDGFLDLAVVSPGGTRVLLGKGDGQFRSTHLSYITAGGFDLSVAVGDFNRDGFPDLAVVGGSNVVSILLNDGNWPP
jgi:hypothetical protein